MIEISLLGATEIRKIAAELDLNPSKGLGQNFVHDANTCEKIVRLAGVSRGAKVLEVGPGLGSLTLALIRSGAHVTAVEIDKRLASRLAQTLVEHGANPTSFEVIVKDALQLEEDEIPRDIHLVANLPYNVSVPVLLHLLSFGRIRSGVVMVQSEVAYRLAASSSSKEYGVPSVKLNWYADAEVRDRVSTKVFWPEPRVDSALLAFQIHAPLGNEQERELTFEITDVAFNQRRKMLRASLADLIGRRLGTGKKNVEAFLKEIGIDPTLRAEALDVKDYLAIARHLLALERNR